MSINRFPLNHKNWYWFLIFLVNILIPVIIAIMRLGEDVHSITDVFPFVSFAFLFIFMILVVIYIWATFREYRACLSILNKKKAEEYFNNFVKGIVFTFFSILLFSFISFLSFKYKSATWCKVLGYITMTITAVFGVVSNVFLNMFEFRVGFEVFHRRYKDTVFKEVVDSIDERNKPSRNSYARYR